MRNTENKRTKNPSVPKELYGIAHQKTTQKSSCSRKKSALEIFSSHRSFPLKGACHA